MKRLSCLAVSWVLAFPWAQVHAEPGNLIFSGNYQNGEFDSLTFVNSVVGWDLFINSGFAGGSTVIGNLEGGQVWFDHQVFQRAPGATTGYHTYTNPAPGSRNELDFHATMVGHVLAGTGYVVENGEGLYTYAGLGMAPAATLVTGGIATAFSSTHTGEFSTTEASVITAYQSFFQGSGLGTGVARPDVINSSWGGADSAAISTEAMAIDGLAHQNASVALVVGAGNSDASPVAFPASGYNNISVGSLGGSSFLEPSTFSSRGLVDFHNPQTGVTLTGVRAAVDMAAPGELFALAAYLGQSGAIGANPDLADIVQEPSPTDLYFLNNDGTSFASPMVAGGIALLKDAAKTILAANPAAMDTRVIKSVLMAGSQKTIGWDNGQNAMQVTTQALDATTGAGAMDLVGAADVYYFGTQDLPANAGGPIANTGWDSATIPLGAAIDYVFTENFTQDMSLTVALNWFALTNFDDASQTGSAIAFSNLDLQVWSLNDEGLFSTMLGQSMSTYNNTEFLRLDDVPAGKYGLRVAFSNLVYDTSNSVTQEPYGLAWRAVPIPEPHLIPLLASAGALFLCRRNRRPSLTQRLR